MFVLGGSVLPCHKRRVVTWGFVRGVMSVHSAVYVLGHGSVGEALRCIHCSFGVALHFRLLPRDAIYSASCAIYSITR